MKVNITRTNGNVPKTLPGQDHISGLVAYVDTLPTAFVGNPVHACSSLETAEKLGITAGSKDWDIKVLHYHLSEAYRVNPAISLYVGLFVKPAGDNYTFSEIKTAQNFAGGSLRQVAVYCGHKELSANDLTALQGIATTLENASRPLMIMYAPKVPDVIGLPTKLAGANMCNVSVLIGQAGSGLGAELYADAANAKKNTVSAIGLGIGILSKAAVHQSIAWVERFPTGIELPAFGDGILLRDLDSAFVESLDASRYLFFVTYDGLAGSYFNDSHTMDAATSDYSHIEHVRTMDKAERGIRKALLPKLGGELYVDPDTGQLQPYEVEYLQEVANKPLEDMRKAGELSGVSVEIDPDQNVLSTSSIEIIIKQVGVGVLRHINCKIGFAQSLNS